MTVELLTIPTMSKPVFLSRSSHRGRTIHLSAAAEFSKTLARTINRINSIISSKLDDFFELAGYEWTPSAVENTPSMYLYELVNWLTTVVDGLNVKDVYKDEAYKGAVTHVAESLLVCLLPPEKFYPSEVVIFRTLLLAETSQ